MQSKKKPSLKKRHKPKSHLTHSTDEQLLAFCQEAAEKANKTDLEEGFNEVYKRYKSFLIKEINRKVSNQEDAEDIFIEVSVRIYKALPTLNITVSLKAWIGGIIHNIVVDYYRAGPISGQKIQEIPIGLANELAEKEINLNIINGGALRSIVLNPTQAVEKKELIRQALQKLKKRYVSSYEVIEDIFFRELTSKEAAEKSDRSLGGVRQAKKRAIDRLRIIFSEIDND